MVHVFIILSNKAKETENKLIYQLNLVQYGTRGIDLVLFEKEEKPLKKIFYYLLIVVLVAALLYNVIFDFDMFALIINIGALAGLIMLPRMK